MRKNHQHTTIRFLRWVIFELSEKGINRRVISVVHLKKHNPPTSRFFSSFLFSSCLRGKYFWLRPTAAPKVLVVKLFGCGFAAMGFSALALRADKTIDPKKNANMHGKSVKNDLSKKYA